MTEYLDNQLHVLSKTVDNLLSYASGISLDKKTVTTYDQELFTVISRLHQLRGYLRIGKVK